MDLFSLRVSNALICNHMAPWVWSDGLIHDHMAPCAWVRKSWRQSARQRLFFMLHKQKTDRRVIRVGGRARNSPKDITMVMYFFPWAPPLPSTTSLRYFHLWTLHNSPGCFFFQPNWPSRLNITLSCYLGLHSRKGKKACFWSTEHEGWRRKQSYLFWSAQSQLLATKQRWTYPELSWPKIPSNGNWYREIVEIDAEVRSCVGLWMSWSKVLANASWRTRPFGRRGKSLAFPSMISVFNFP